MSHPADITAPCWSVAALQMPKPTPTDELNIIPLLLNTLPVLLKECFIIDNSG